MVVHKDKGIRNDALFLCQFRALDQFRTEVGELTFLAVRLARCADIAAVQQEPVVGPGNLFFGDVLRQFHLNLVWGVGPLCDQA